MTTLLLTEVFPPRTGGSGRWFYEIYRRLPKAEYLIAAGQHPQQEVFDRGHDLRLQRLPLSLPSWGLLGWAALRGQWQQARQVHQLANQHHIDTLHCGKCLPEGLTALLLRWWRGLPYLCYVHGEELNLALGSRELTWWTRRVLHQATLLIANSRNTASILRRDWGIPARQIYILHPGVDTKSFVPSPRISEIRARLGWDDRRVILTVGRLQKRKGHDQMILALKSIRQSIPDVLYAIVGDGEERDALRALVAHEGLTEHVQFRGEPADAELVQCYQQCDLFVLPNRQVGNDIEGFGMVLLEAQSCGKPVIAGASGGTAETMRIPETGRVVNCDGPDALADVVTDLLTNPSLCEQMGQAAREWVVGQFDWSALSRQAELLFQIGPAAKASQRNT